MKLDIQKCKIVRSKISAWFSDFNDAEQVILNNYGDIFEDNYYNIALIEKVNKGLYPESTCVSWYEAIYEDPYSDPVSIKKIEMPTCLDKICNFGIG